METEMDPSDRVLQALSQASGRTQEDVRRHAEIESGHESFTAARVITLNRCDALIELPHEIGMLTRLVRFSVCECENLIRVPPEIGQLQLLHELRIIRCTNLEQLPPEIGQLQELGELYLPGCRSLAQLPREIGDLYELFSLNLIGCWGLTCLPNEIGLLTNLRELRLSGCTHLEELPGAIGNLENLEVLDLSLCSSITELPMELESLASLEMLQLHGCTQLTEIPIVVLQALTNLRTLFLRQCRSLTTTSQEIGEASYSLTDVTTPYNTMQPEMNCYLAWNSAGRYLLRKDKTPFALWPNVLANSTNNPNVLFLFLTNKPEICGWGGTEEMKEQR